MINIKSFSLIDLTIVTIYVYSPFQAEAPYSPSPKAHSYTDAIQLGKLLFIAKRCYYHNIIEIYVGHSLLY